VQRFGKLLLRLSVAERREHVADTRRRRGADIYMTEFDRIFRHFYFRDIANELAKGDEEAAIFLDETDGWTDSSFKSDSVQTNRRLMFFSPLKTTGSAMPLRDDQTTADWSKIKHDGPWECGTVACWYADFDP
jgi:hypothetical protein